MKNKIFKPLRTGNCFIALTPFSLCGEKFPKNTIVHLSQKERTMYICKNFPQNYMGKLSKIILEVSWYDMDTKILGETTIKNCDVSKNLYSAFVNCGKPQMGKIQEVPNYEKLMEHTKKKKKASGRPMSNHAINDSMRYNQNTVYAYWENLDSRESGNASIIASRIPV